MNIDLNPDIERMIWISTIPLPPDLQICLCHSCGSNAKIDYTRCFEVVIVLPVVGSQFLLL